MQEQHIEIINLDIKPWIIHYENGDVKRYDPDSNIKLEFILWGKINTIWNGIKVAQRKTLLWGQPAWNPNIIYLIPREYFQFFINDRKQKGVPNDCFTHGENAKIEYIFYNSDDDSESEGDITIEKEEILVCYDGLIQEI